VRAYNEAVGSYEARVLPAARRFEEHGSVAAGRDLGELEHVTVSARTLRVPELESGEGGGGGGGGGGAGGGEPVPEQLTMRRLRAAE
jgi:hypothetical protein